jgi:two-component system, OmpR family, sensor histidine kinase BaeS
MFRSLRSRLILSHILPTLIITPVIGISLIYVLESQFLLPGLSRELVGEARLLAEMATGQQLIWRDPAYAREILAHVSPDLTARVMLIGTNGELVASSDPNDQDRLNRKLDSPGLSLAQAGQLVARTNYSQAMQAEVVDVFAPVKTTDQRVVGIVRLSHRYNTVAGEIIRLRYWILGILLFGLMGGILLGLWIAVTISNPLRRVTRAVYSLARGNQRQELAVEGPDEIQHMLRAVNLLVESLHNLEESRRLLLANLIHELGRPLGAVRSALQALIRGAKYDAQVLDELLAGMDDETVRLQQVVEDLGNLQDHLVGHLELDRQSVALNDWLRRVGSLWRESAAAKEISLQVRLSEDLPAVEIDMIRLGQALGNLISNAIKFTPPGGQVILSGGVMKGNVWIRVEDNGPGIADQELESIFSPFYRGPQGQHHQPGMGLGLSIAREIVSAHGGKLEVESHPGEGSRFTIWLPGSAG